MECPICLEPMRANTRWAKVHNCGHTYHHQCALQWVEHLNLCPTCRLRFHRLDVVQGGDGANTVITTLTVRDRLPANEAINNIPRQYVIRPGQNLHPPPPEDPLDDPALTPGVCIICFSAQVSRLQLLGCTACGGKFHRRCLAATTFASMWFCPVCDTSHEIADRARPGPALRPEPPVVLRGRTAAWDDADFDDRAGTGATRPRPDNGGARIRREVRAAQNQTPEETRLWQAWESARSGTAYEPELVLATTTARKKRPRAGPKAGAPAPSSLGQMAGAPDSLSGSSGQLPSTSVPSGPSRIGRLMGEIRSRQRTRFAGPDSTPDAASPDVIDLTEPDAPAHSEAGPALISSTNAPALLSTSDLTLLEKEAVQRHVRHQLRPYYQSAQIASESEYIAVNKSVSRQVYAEIVFLRAHGSDILAEDKRLGLVVSRCIGAWSPAGRDQA